MIHNSFDVGEGNWIWPIKSIILKFSLDWNRSRDNLVYVNYYRKCIYSVSYAVWSPDLPLSMVIWNGYEIRRRDETRLEYIIAKRISFKM